METAGSWHGGGGGCGENYWKEINNFFFYITANTRQSWTSHIAAANKDTGTHTTRFK
jgi:hypothetical protein